MAAFLLKSVVLLTCKWLPFFWRVSCSLHVNTTAPNQQLFVRWSFVVNFFSTISFILLFPCDNQNIYMHAFHNPLPQSFTYISYCLSKEEFEDTKGVIRIRISKNKHNGQKNKHNSQKKKHNDQKNNTMAKRTNTMAKRKNNDLQNIHIKQKIK